MAGYKKIIGEIILIFIISTSLQASILNLWEYPSSEDSSVLLSFQRLYSDMWDIKGRFFSFLPIANNELDYAFSFQYTSLGSFDFVNSDGFAYKDTYRVEGHQYSFAMGASLPVDPFYIEGSAGLKYQQIGDNYYNDLQFISECLLAYNSPVGQFSGGVNYLDESFTSIIGYGFHFSIDKITVNLKGFYEISDNQTIKVFSSFQNYVRDFQLFLITRFGLIYPIYELFTIGITKKLEQMEYFFSFSPSLIENNLFEAGLTYHFPNVKNELDFTNK